MSDQPGIAETVDGLEMVRLHCPACSWASSWRPAPEVGPVAPKDIVGSYEWHFRDKHMPKPTVERVPGSDGGSDG